MMNYEQFIASKIPKVQARGFEPILPIIYMAFDWQKVVIRWSIRQGCCALFEDCGLGKTLQQLEWARQVVAKTKGRVLILCPLAVAAQTVAEGAKFGIKVEHVHTADDIDSDSGIFITNYERLHLFLDIIGTLTGVVLDESSILKSFTGKTRKELTDAFSNTPHRLCCTATPSPNDFTELGQHAEFLGVCSTGEMLATFFLNDTANTGTWRLKGHAADDFWRWVSSWAACISKPSDLGFSDDGFILPPLNMQTVTVKVDQSSKRPDGELFRNPQLSATNIHAEMRFTCDNRVAAVKELIGDSKETWIVWCNTNYEADALRAALPNAVEVRGSDEADRKEKKLWRFTNGDDPQIITKPGIAGYGLNWQHCHNVIFVGLSYSFEDFYQALRRSYRFGQKKTVNCWVIQADTEGDIFQVIKRKINQHEEMRQAMRFSAETILGQKTITIMNTEIERETGEGWELYHGDCVRVAETMEDNSVGFSIFSPPFADLFVYSADVQDMGNNTSMEDFLTQFGFLVRHLLRVTQPGRLCAVHCADLLATKWKDGEIELKNFSGQIVDLFRDAGWLYHCRATIWKDPVIEMQRTKSLGLLHKQLCKDSAMSRVGMPEYVCVFRKPGRNENPISHEREDYPVEQWQKDASPVWMDIDQTNVLNGRNARGDKDERHICPLQLDVINRALRLWSNPGDLVFSPFTGIGSEGYCAIKNGRKFIGAELKESYADQAKVNLECAVEECRTLFALA